MPENLPATQVSKAPEEARKTRPIQVLIAHYLSHAVSGAERSIADLVEEMGPGFRCTMLVPGDGNLAEFYRKRGFSVWSYRVETSRRLYPGLHTIQSFLLANKLKREGFDVVLANTFSAASRVGTAARMAGIPFGVYIREYISDRPVHRKILNKADRIFTISKDLQGYIRSMTTDPEKVLLTYNHIRPLPVLDRAAAHRANGDRRLPFQPECPAIGLVGRITRFKQQDLFIRSIPLVLRDVPEAHFVIVGTAQEREKDYEASVKLLAAELGVQDHITFMGQRKDVIEITSELTVSCVTSDREPLGRVILEAALIGCPVVVPDTGGPAEIVEDGITGLKYSSIQPDSDQQLADKIVKLLQDPALRLSLAGKAKERIMTTFAGDIFVQTQEKYIEQLASTKANRYGPI